MLAIVSREVNRMSEVLVEVKNLRKYFKVKKKGMLHAVEDVSFQINEGETLGLVGESGCGKSTVGNLIMRLIPADSGEIYYKGMDIRKLKGKEAKDMCKNMQVIFQDPYSSLNPRKDIKGILSESYIVQHICKGRELESRIEELCETNGITQEDLQKFPHELDGGKRQMVGIARALSLNPKFIVCDEPVSALDVSVQARIINLLMDLQRKFGIAYLFVSHDLSVVRHISNRIAVMYLGQIVEICNCDELFENPLHPYTIALLSAIPNVDIDNRMNRIILKGDVPSPVNPKPGCRFAGRCYRAQSICSEQNPVLEEKSAGHFVSCHLVPPVRSTIRKIKE